MYKRRNNIELKDFLERKVLEFNRPSFIKSDPVSVPHLFCKKQDIEISALFTAIFSWGNRTTIIQKSLELMKNMDDAPYDFIQNHQPADLKRFLHFKHRTFNTIDLLYFINFLQYHYRHTDSLESAFLPDEPGMERRIQSEVVRVHSAEIKEKKIMNCVLPSENEIVKKALTVFYKRFFSLENVPNRTVKHIASPDKNSTCKRLNMFLRWMIRKDNNGVDFGIWTKISPADLICPVDLHVSRVARDFRLINRKQTDWDTAMELTRALRILDPFDPVKFDFALFGIGVTEKY